MSHQRTKVDWLAFRTQAEPRRVHATLQQAYGPIGDAVHLVAREGGYQGYRQRADVLIADMPVGLVAWGGQAQRGWVYTSISGRGCEWLGDIDAAQDRLEGLDAYQLRRVDIALDTHSGEVTHDTVLTAYRAGRFHTGGRPPKMQQVLPEQVEDGRTIYVGSRERDKFLRGYEKGRELTKGTGATHIDGVPVADMYRLELELKAKSAPLPPDLIDRRDQYFAGAYPYLQELLGDVEAEILVARRERGPQLDLARALEACRQQYGATLFTALVAHHGDFGAVWAKVVGEKHNAALLRAGVLLVDHD